MAGEIQTSFIPKAPIATAAYRPASRPSSVGFMTVIGLILVLSSVAIFGGAFVWQEVRKQELEATLGSIKTLKDGMPISDLQRIERLNASLNNANTLLNGHVSANSIFTVLQANTVPRVRYTSYSFKGSEVEVKGTAPNYSEIVAQANQLKKITTLKSFDFADFTVNPQTKLVNFSLALSFAPEAYKYTAQGFSSGTLPVATTTVTN